MTSHITLIFCSLLSIQPVIVNTEGIYFPKLLASQTKLEFFDFMDIRLELRKFIFMKIQEYCERMIHDADPITQIAKIISQCQKCYKKAVEKYYQQNPLFLPQTNPEDEIKLYLPQIYVLVKHSIIIGNNELIEKYLIKPVFQKKLSISSEIIAGIDIYLEKPDIKGNPINKSYFEWTKKELENLMK